MMAVSISNASAFIDVLAEFADVREASVAGAGVVHLERDAGRILWTTICVLPTPIRAAADFAAVLFSLDLIFFRTRKTWTESSLFVNLSQLSVVTENSSAWSWFEFFVMVQLLHFIP